MAEVLLVVPSHHNPWAPGARTPLLSGALRAAGRTTRVLDLNVEHTDWLLSPAGLTEMLERSAPRAGIDPRAWRAAVLADSTLAGIETARTTLRTPEGLADPAATRAARTVLRNASAIVSAAFEGLDFDLVANEGHYSQRSTADALAAARDPERNLARWCLDRLLPADILDGVQVVGIDLSADSQLLGAISVAQVVRERRPGLPVFGYGDYATRMATGWTGPHPFLDLIGDILTHEPEESGPLLVEELLASGRVKVPGRIRVHGGRLQRTDPEPVDLNTLPFADFDGMALDRYLGPGPVFPSLSSRGCPWRCEFCSIPFTNGRFRRRRAARTVDELEQLATRWGARYVLFTDETMTVPGLRSVATEILERGLDLRWACETRFTGKLDPELTRLLYRSGARRIEFGLESYNQRVLDLMRKETTLAEIDHDIESTLSAGISVHLFGIAGFPGEMAEETRRTADYIEHTIARAESEFGVRGSTSGLGRFQLDPLAPMSGHLDDFGVRAGAGGDLTLMTLDYDVEAGISASGVDEVLGGDPPAEVFFHTGTIKDAREENFVRASLGLPVPAQRRLVPLAWPDPGPHDLRIPFDVSVTPLPRPGSSEGGFAYRVSTDALVPLTSAELEMLSRLEGIPAETRTAWLRYGILETTRAASHPLDDPGDWVATPDPYTRATTSGLVNPVIGTSARLDAGGQQLWSAITEGLRLADREGLDPPVHDRILAAVAELARMGMVAFTTVQAIEGAYAHDHPHP